MSQSVRTCHWLLIGFVLVAAVGGTLLVGADEPAEVQALEGTPSANALAVTQVVPADGTVGIETDATLVVTFDRPVVPLTGISTGQSADLPHPLVLDPAVSGTGDWLNTSTYRFTPSLPLDGGTTYTATVTAGLSAVDGSVLEDAFVWQFTTVRPRIVWFSPSENEELVPIDTSVVIQFNMPIDATSLEERLTVRTAGLFGELFSRTVSGTLEVEEDVATFTPDAPLSFDARYVVSIEAGVTGAAGGLGTSQAKSWRFRTVPLPKIIGTDPSDGERRAYPYTSFEIEFNTPIDPDTVLDHVSIDPAPAPEDLDGWYRRWSDTYVVSFGAKPSTDYTVQITPGIADRYGNTTEQRLTVSFRTAPLSPIAWLHVPGRTSTLNASADARLVVGHRNVGRLEFAIWRLDLAEYFEAIDDWYDFVPHGRADRSWSVAVSAPLNEAAYAAVDLAEGGGPLSPGIYVLELRADGIDWDRWNHRHLLISSPVNLTLKTSEDEILAWATDLETGAPIPGMILRTYDADGDSFDAAVTDSRGLATLAPRSANDWRATAVVGNDPFVVASTDWSDGISTWDLGLSRQTPPEARAYVDTDRPIYRPDQTVYFRGLIRGEDDVVYFLPEARTVDVTIRDPEWDVVYEASLPVDTFGAFSDLIELAEDAVLGEYGIRVEAGDRTFYHEFQVAAYRTPEFEVTVTPEWPEIARGEPVRAAVEAAYFYGAPVIDVPVEWDVVSSAYRFAPDAFGRYTFTDVDDPWICWYCWWIPAPSPTSILGGSGRTDEGGLLFLDLAVDPEETQTGSRQWTIEATAQGPSGEVISGRETIIAHQGDFYVGLATDRAIGRAGEETSLDVVTVDWDALRVGNLPLRYTVVLREWINVFEENETGGGRWTWTTLETQVAEGSLTTDAAGDGRVTFIPEQGGSYKVIVEGEDEDGRTVRSSRFLWVIGPESVSWRRTNDDTITLISDRSSYAVGDTAEILIPSPYEGEQWALVTVERGGILSRDVVLLPTNSSTIRVPITEDHIPNAYVGVVLIQGREAALAAAAGAPAAAGTKVGYLALTVDPAPRTLRIEFDPSAERLEPGDTLALDLRVTDALGLPVEASFSLDLVDKAVLSLQPREADVIVSTFYGRRGLGVGTASGLVISLTRLALEQLDDLDLFEEEADKDAMLAAEAPGGAFELAPEPMATTGLRMADDMGAEGLLPEGVEVREEFLDTAFWHPSIVTDVTGEATIEVTLPDNLTTWVVRAVGATRDTLVGEETTEILVTKPLLVRPVTPRFLVIGDRVRFAAVVSNQTEDDLSVEVTFGAVGLSLEDPAVQTVEIPAGGETTVTWWATVPNVESADVIFSAVSGELSDAARPRLTLGPDGTLPVLRYTARETVGTAGQLTEEGSRIEALAMPETFDPAMTQLRVRVEPSLAAAMTEGLSYLEHFEYECTEQLVSRFLPNALTYRALRLLGIEDPELEAKLIGLVAYGLDELADRQNADGGWGWWWGDRSNPHLTAYVVYGLLRVADAGFEVADVIIERGLERLIDELAPMREIDSPWDANRQAWLLYVLALGGETSTASEYAGALFEERAKLSHYGTALLAMALDEIGGVGSSLDVLVSDLVNDAILSATGAHWEEGSIDWWAMNTDTRSTAIILDALVQIDPENPMLPNVVRWLMVARRAGIWETTQETAWALIALTDWMTVTGELQGNYEMRVGLDEAPILIDSVTPETIRDPREVSVAGSELIFGATHLLSFARSAGEGRMYYTAHLTLGLPAADVEALDRGMQVQRTYVESIEEDEDGNQTIVERSAIAVGDTFEVRLTIVAPNDLYYVVVEDPIPAGCEAVDTSLATTSILEPNPGITREEDYPWWGWWWNWYSRSEFRDDKVVLFADYLAAGTYTYTYTLRGLVPGTYGVLPTMAHEFYFPEVFGRSDGRAFEVTEAGSD